ncbi:MAG TPA: response regulator transcription factor [Acidimicrobiales bacterium]|nr:response regulator transcription factor [Acidimicrobiales bacterium]
MSKAGSRRVLIAEDHQGMRDLVHRLVDLEDGLEVVGVAANGQEVLDQAASLSPDAIVLDLGLPQIDGEVALRELRSKLPDAHIIVLSGQASALIQPRLLEEGADAVIEKDSAYPSWQEDLLARLRLGRQAG